MLNKKRLFELFPKIYFGVISIALALLGMGYVGEYFTVEPFTLSQLTGVVIILAAGYTIMWCPAFKEKSKDA